MNSKHAIPPEWRDYIAGGGAAVANICITYPVYKTSFRQIVHGFSTRNAIHQLRKEGLRILFRGSLPPLLQKGTSTSLLFGTNAQYQRVLKERIGLREEFHVQAGAAFMAVHEPFIRNPRFAEGQSMSPRWRGYCSLSFLSANYFVLVQDP